MERLCEPAPAAALARRAGVRPALIAELRRAIAPRGPALGRHARAEVVVLSERVRAAGGPRVRPLLSRLDPRWAVVVERRCLSEPPETLAAIGGALGITRERVRQIERHALAGLVAWLDAPPAAGPWRGRARPLLGRLPDVQVARIVGRPASDVRVERRRLGIAPPDFGGRAGGPPAWVRAARPMLGRVPDRVVAETLGRSLSSVWTWRRRLGIEASQPRPWDRGRDDPRRRRRRYSGGSGQ
jgi:hypothetical protein